MTTMCEFQQTSPGSFRVFRQDATAHPEACPICLDEIEKDAYGLPCKHTFHAECLLTLRRSPNSQVCPLCRADLPPGPKELFEEAAVHYREIEARVNSGDADWEALDGQDRVKFDEVLFSNREHKSISGNVFNFFYDLRCVVCEIRSGAPIVGRGRAARHYHGAV
mmetsp:Transcript_45776/g.103369  ORF Transcript_45776/g.103369 Transcript_45776/m.103369 type:complete len:165 (+) Transcript_45776:139-633(+)